MIPRPVEYIEGSSEIGARIGQIQIIDEGVRKIAQIIINVASHVLVITGRLLAAVLGKVGLPSCG